MRDTPGRLPKEVRGLRRRFRAMNRLMVLLWRLGLGRLMNSWPPVGGRIMLIQHRGRRTGKLYLTPVNFVLLEDGLYSTAGFGEATDWYRNILADPNVQLWLPQGWCAARAEEVSDSPQRVRLLRLVIIASGLAGRLLGVDQRKYSDEALAAMTKDYRLVHFDVEASDALYGS
jgi:deazaflavin-dependent oxidoreductase (nitroreductase family)